TKRDVVGQGESATDRSSIAAQQSTSGKRAGGREVDRSADHASAAEDAIGANDDSAIAGAGTGGVINQKRAGANYRGPTIGVVGSERQRAGADFGKTVARNC